MTDKPITAPERKEPFHASKTSDGEKEWFSAYDPAAGVSIPAKDRDDAYALVASINSACAIHTGRRLAEKDAEIARLRTVGQDAHDALTNALHLLPDDCNQRIGMEGALSRLTAALYPTTEQEGEGASDRAIRAP